MAKLTKAQTKAHRTAQGLLQKQVLTENDRDFVLDNWHPGADHNTGYAGAFFTPRGLAHDFMIDARGLRVLDLCAGIGTLSLPHYYAAQWDREARERLQITCVEINPAYVAVGKKIAPWARWICADAFEMTPADLGAFDVVISNPPFGKVARAGSGPRYTGAEFEFHLIDHAAQFAPRGAFIVPAMSAPFKSKPYHQYLSDSRAHQFMRQTGIHLDAGCGIDCDFYRHEWQDVAPAVEIITADFETAKPLQAPTMRPLATQLDLLAAE